MKHCNSESILVLEQRRLEHGRCIVEPSSARRRPIFASALVRLVGTTEYITTRITLAPHGTQSGKESRRRVNQKQQQGYFLRHNLSHGKVDDVSHIIAYAQLVSVNLMNEMALVGRERGYHRITYVYRNIDHNKNHVPVWVYICVLLWSK